MAEWMCHQEEEDVIEMVAFVVDNGSNFSDTPSIRFCLVEMMKQAASIPWRGFVLGLDLIKIFMRYQSPYDSEKSLWRFDGEDGTSKKTWRIPRKAPAWRIGISVALQEGMKELNLRLIQLNTDKIGKFSSKLSHAAQPKCVLTSLRRSASSGLLGLSRSGAIKLEFWLFLDLQQWWNRLVSPHFQYRMWVLLSVDEETSLSGAHTKSVFGLFNVPAKWYPWILLIIFQVLMANVSLLGHLCGIFSGVGYNYGLFSILIPGTSFYTTIEGSPLLTRVEVALAASDGDLNVVVELLMNQQRHATPTCIDVCIERYFCSPYPTGRHDTSLIPFIC
ncbi:hypothetical protein SAY87_018695 [Trapa incisa]|uniref:Uncharacterized protein n=1 Tax=Trapa incisa TaxID=236973 RepID=A0AAN7K380_9MYRT|nr:hypothetical protein SAY87_018695 [Trapa incisa]